MKELQAIQQELKVPKGQLNKFSSFYYRSCEDILEEVKPLLKKHKVFLTITDKIVNIGERYYIKATATLSNEEGKEVKVTGYAREEKVKKGMDGSQITGSSSSYARKYALNGMFLIDDGKDADSMDNRKEEKKTTSTSNKRNATSAQVKYLKGLGWQGDAFKLTFEEADKQIKLLSKE
jgi:hypothetical protein